MAADDGFHLSQDIIRLLIEKTRSCGDRHGDCTVIIGCHKLTLHAAREEECGCDKSDRSQHNNGFMFQYRRKKLPVSELKQLHKTG